MVSFSPDKPHRGFNESLLKAFPFRALGPYRAGSWVTSFAVPDAPARDHLYTFYVGTRNGGVWKTTNNGTTFEPIFDGQPKLSIGDVAVAPVQPEHRLGRDGRGLLRPVARTRATASTSPTDAGKTWTNMGLRDSHHIARIVIHPDEPRHRLRRGHGPPLLARTRSGASSRRTDGGKTWKQGPLSSTTTIGVIDLVMVKSDPDTLYAAPVRQGPPALALRARAARRAASTRRPTAARRGRGSPAGCPTGQDRPDRDRHLSRRTPGSSTPWSRTATGGPPTRREIDQAKRRGPSPRPGPSATRSTGPTTAARPGARSTRRQRGQRSTRRPIPSTSSGSTRTTPTRSTSPASRWPARPTAARPGKA